MTLYNAEISRLKKEFEDIQRMILGQEQVLCLITKQDPESVQAISAILNCQDIKQRKAANSSYLSFFFLRNQITNSASWITVYLQVLHQASQTQTTLKATSNRLTRDMQGHLVSIKLLNQSLERYLDQVEGWKDVIEETEEKMKTLMEDQYGIKATAQQINMTVALR